MNSILKARMCLPIAAMFLTSAFAASSTQVPFSGSVQGQEADVLQGNPPDMILVNGSLAGVATLLGRFTLTYDLRVSLPASSSTGSAQLIAANGDMIFTAIVGQAEPVLDTPGLLRIVEINTITGGTASRVLRGASLWNAWGIRQQASLPVRSTGRLLPRVQRTDNLTQIHGVRKRSSNHPMARIALTPDAQPQSPNFYGSGAWPLRRIRPGKRGSTPRYI